jgi:putative membrane protein
MTITPQDHIRIAEAIRAVEARTSGEIVCVLARASSEYAAAPLLWASLTALLAPWPLILYTELPVRSLFAVQILVYVAALVLFSIRGLRVFLTPRRTRRAFAHRAASEQFMTRRISHTRERTGVLIFVSLAERYARIIADEGIASKVDQREWQAAIDALTRQMRDGHMTDGFLAAIAACGEVLAHHAPPGKYPREELPDRLYLM